MEPETLAGCLHSAEFGDWLAHMAALFVDVRFALVRCFAALHGIGLATLDSTYRAIRAETGERSFTMGPSSKISPDLMDLTRMRSK